MKFQPILLLVLILSLPAANALSISRNTGKMDGFLDGEGDKWELEVLTPTSDPQLVTVNGFPFDSCRQAPNGYICMYEYVFDSGRIYQAVYELEIKDETDTIYANITVDASAPKIKEISAGMAEGGMRIDFDAKDMPEHCAGIDKIEFFDGDVLLETANVDVGCEYTNFTFVIGVPFEGTAAKSIKVVLTDNLGHSYSVYTPSVNIDNVIPVILENTFRVGDIGDYIGPKIKPVDLSIKISEDELLESVTAFSSELGLEDKAVCEFEEGDYVCVWKEVSVENDFNIEIKVFDGQNKVSKTISKNFNLDATPPKIISFSTNKTFKGDGYVSRMNTFRALIDEDESGVSPEDVFADFSELGYGVRRASADTCVKEGGNYVCYWEDVMAKQSGDVHLVDAQDTVGNIASSLASSQVITDSEFPQVTDFKITPVHGSTAGREALQSRDVVKVKFHVDESNGYTAYVNVSSLTGAKELYEASCSNNTCEYVTERIKSGYIADAPVEVYVEDTAGNGVRLIKSVKVYALDEETDPDYWEIGNIKVSPPFIDSESLEYLSPRIYYSMPLKTGSDVEMLSFAVKQCALAEDSPFDPGSAIEDVYAINNIESTNPYVVVQLAQGENVSSFKLNCSFDVYSRRGTSIVAAPQVLNEKLDVVVQTSGFSNVVENLEEEIDAAKDDAEGVWAIIGTLKQVIDYAKILCKGLNIIQMVGATIKTLAPAWDALRIFPGLRETATAGCASISVATDPPQEATAKAFDKFCNIINCRFSPLSFIGAEGIADFYSDWSGGFGVGSVSDTVTKATGAVSDPQSSLVGSLFNFCIPGIVYNLDKYRQIQCRYVGCLENEVAAGISTVQACRELKGYQECKYLWGEIFHAIPFVGLIEATIQRIKQFITDPIGIAFTVARAACVGFCPASGAGYTMCSHFAYLDFYMKLFNDIISLAEDFKKINKDYCSEVL